ncbi:glycolate oxidase subunit GlcE [Thalassospira xiamenensis]|uniref:glycolate oxidase subunit GlcE n=1 Tax=Thalassospira xiamenensis TaxID=220697 RepID=UPI000DEDDF62|nr:glycolate oxidase subunit GlcE [Thalassospira xiamenensis]MBR9778809.1 glycolate oxidase subunit GlcE [Rhodospirillales bacterium]MBR9818014.1 glycolate oxidase subunit GlcE [Rhodospirillales bacterium]RCK42155.1 glycolate oxidase [Thalassospira xiamenensis]
MTEVISPTTPEQLREAISWALGSKNPLEIIGSGSKKTYGHAVAADHVLDLSKLTGVMFYEPEELVVSVRAGTSLAEIHALLRDKNQQFHFEPGNFPGLLADGVTDHAGTIGGLIASNLSGPRRIKVGAARDHLLGFEAISGRAEDFKSGGRVMKNVTGFDLSKLMAGSFGTLGVMHTITMKVMPRDEKTRTVLIACDDMQIAGSAMTRALGSENEVSAAAWIAREQVVKLGLDIVTGIGAGIVALRVEGPAPSVAWRCEALRKLLADIGASEELHSANSNAFWQAVADVVPFAGGIGLLWRVSGPPASGGAIAAKLADETGGKIMMDWAGAQIWLQLAGGDAMADKVRDIAVSYDARAVLVRAPEDIRNQVPVFHAEDAALARINARIRENFDPEGILNPGRIGHMIAKRGNA